MTAPTRSPARPRDELLLPDRLRAWVQALCSERCAGRRAGSPEGRAARAVIAEGLRALGLKPCAQPVQLDDGEVGENLHARVGGAGRRLVLVGAHHDHLGRAPSGAYWGADDNAAAVALVLELARALAADPAPGGDVVLVAFDAEEPPHFLVGSSTFVRDPPVPLQDIELMIALDLVGHAIGPPEAPAAVRQTLFALGAETSSGTAALVDETVVPGLHVRRLGIDIIPPLSDYEPFRRARVPFLFLSCGRWRHYHRETDTPEKLDYAKLAKTTLFVERLVRAALARPDRPAFDAGARDDAITVATVTAMLEAGLA